MMENDNNSEMLFDYLKSILYDTQTKTLDIEKLDPPYQKLGLGLQYLQHAVEEMLAYSAELSKGNLSCDYPARENLLCTNLKNLHANLNHLTWQAQQVAAGDYSQHVSYLGDFSESFNTMTAQLREREAILKEEAANVKKRAEVIESYNELLVEMTRKRNEWILVVDAESREVMYCNKREDERKIDPDFCEICHERLRFRNSIVNWQDNGQYRVWESGNEEQGFFRITTFQIEWRGCKAYAHIVVNITGEKEEAEKLTSKAYYDTGTGIRNRLYFEEYMDRVLTGNVSVTLCYMDLDGLKYVNDKYGHNEGDEYIHSFVFLIKNAFRSSDIFARIGGDEFCLVLPDSHIETVRKKLLKLLDIYAREKDVKYPRSFSFGLTAISGTDDDRTLRELIRSADLEMYRCKKINKEKYHQQQKEN